MQKGSFFYTSSPAYIFLFSSSYCLLFVFLDGFPLKISKRYSCDPHVLRFLAEGLRRLWGEEGLVVKEAEGGARDRGGE